MGIRLSDIINKNSITVVINAKTRQTRQIIFTDDARAALKFILSTFFDTNKISKKDKILDEKEQVEFYNKIKTYLKPQGIKRVLTREALLKMKDDIFGRKPAAKTNQAPAPKPRYIFYRYTGNGAPAYCTYQQNGKGSYDERWYIISPTGKIEFIDKGDIEPSLETSFEEIWQKRNPRRFDIGDWAPEADYGVTHSTGCAPISLATTFEGGHTVMQSPLCETRALSAHDTGVFSFSRETCVLKFLTEEHAKKFFENLLSGINKLQAECEKPSKDNPHPKSANGLWRVYNELLCRRLWTCKRNNGADSLAIDIGGIIPPPKIIKDAFGNNVAENLEEINLGFKFQHALLEVYGKTLRGYTGGKYIAFGDDIKNIKDIAPREQQKYIKFCTKGMSNKEITAFKSRTLAQQAQKHDDGFWGNTWGKLTLWIETGDKICQTGYHLADVKKAAYAISPPIGKPGSKERTEYNAFKKLYLPRIKSGELLVFQLPTVPSNWATNYFIPQYSDIKGSFLGWEVDLKAPQDKSVKFSDMHDSGKGVIVLVKNTPEARKIYEKAAKDAWNVNTLNALFSADTWEQFNTVQKYYERFDEGVEDILKNWNDKILGTQDIDAKDPFDNIGQSDTQPEELKRSEIILILHALYGLMVGFRIMTDFGCNYVSRAHFTANLVNFFPGIYDMIKMFRKAQTPEDMLQLMFMTIAIFGHGHHAFSKGLKVTTDLENKVAVIRDNRGIVQKVTGEAFEGLLKLSAKALGYKQRMYRELKEHGRMRKEIHPQEVNVHPRVRRGKNKKVKKHNDEN